MGLGTPVSRDRFFVNVEEDTCGQSNTDDACGNAGAVDRLVRRSSHPSQEKPTRSRSLNEGAHVHFGDAVS